MRRQAGSSGQAGCQQCSERVTAPLQGTKQWREKVLACCPCQRSSQSTIALSGLARLSKALTGAAFILRAARMAQSDAQVELQDEIKQARQVSLVRCAVDQAGTGLTMLPGQRSCTILAGARFCVRCWNCGPPRCAHQLCRCRSCTSVAWQHAAHRLILLVSQRLLNLLDGNPLVTSVLRPVVQQTAEGTYGLWPQLLHLLTGILPKIDRAMQPEMRDSFLDQVSWLLTVSACLLRPPCPMMGQRAGRALVCWRHLPVCRQATSAGMSSTPC